MSADQSSSSAHQPVNEDTVQSTSQETIQEEHSHADPDQTPTDEDQRLVEPHPESLGLRLGGHSSGNSYLQRLRNAIGLEHCLNGSSSMIWFCPAYVIDWGVGLAAIVVSKLYLETASPYHRDLSVYFHDTDYHWSLRSEQVPDEWLHHLSVTLPVLLLIILTLITYPRGGIHLIPMLHHSLLGLLVAHSMAIVPTDILKIWIGELRPDFFSRCAYSEDTKICKPFFHNHKLMESGRKSFPSGHSSTAFAGLTFLALWIAGRNGAFALGGDGLRAAGPLQSRLLRLLVAIIWLVIAIWIAVTRIQDHRHHPRDVIAGGIIGIISASIGYLFYFPSPFKGSSLGLTMGKPRLVYDHDTLPHKQAIRGLPSSRSAEDHISVAAVV
ncbi:hypothetical protein MJO28_003278 [Puccinia striiformis f. sp. tritici]|uniref:Phosphatidic acid phosphatase type 2/haloperoxidase domain-containing protein n=2 Tax=Puccinia striiformis f. sp. tritici TaxID=168172 RepID=A0A0L0VG57_9BASI|nr:hypothetical protein Pst134EB_005878 [Puccinia striiformis f. sp. tritici]KAI7959487.1 hypothetical protein MJO28_003278 [Puccinia striiformis f. sp. tritici]KAI7965250.1 hypothetical protein MJO29_003348 [Puccinia striiformis f. sp. tritici]KAI9623154.1 hypothetical protein KEM48_009584 [Puccinia striiformis f. sp. tritici PST-130]KNE97954.1 hypothetical protein PSTG_08827 [Puccinia striiformis f. sp. tritici PST-78]